jgi:hypothetical protein
MKPELKEEGERTQRRRGFLEEKKKKTEMEKERKSKNIKKRW